MDVTAIHRIAQALPAAAAATSPDQAAQGREVVQAVKALNETEMFGQDNQLEFQRDQASRRMVIRVINRKTNEVISQVPPEYVLRLAQDLQKA
jgi:flagellar protein FlaG